MYKEIGVGEGITGFGDSIGCDEIKNEEEWVYDVRPDI